MTHRLQPTVYLTEENVMRKSVVSRSFLALSAIALATALFLLIWGRHASRVAAQSAPACVTPPSGMVAWWPGDGNTNDIKSNNNGALQNGATFAAGKVGQAFSFDGVDDFVSFGSGVGNFGTGDFT